MASTIVILLTVFTVCILRRRLPLQNCLTVLCLAAFTLGLAQLLLREFSYSLEPNRLGAGTVLDLHWTTPLLWAVIVINTRELMRWIFGTWRGNVFYALIVIGAGAAITAVSWRCLTISDETPAWIVFILAVVTQLLFFPFTIDKKPKPHITTSPSSRY